MTLTLHYLDDGTFAAEIPTEDGNRIVFSKSYDTDPAHSNPYAVLAAVLLSMYRIILPPISETNLIEPGEADVTARIA